MQVVCAVGKRAYYATRLLRQRGLDAQLMPGGMRTLGALKRAGALRSPPAVSPTSPS